jgi:soluble lytic murein transglycosylase-like protein
MDGTTVVALLIVILFFSSFPAKRTGPADAPQPKQDTYSAPAPASTSSEFPPKQESTPQPTTPSEPPAYYVYMDKSISYQYLEYDRMEAIIRKYNKTLPQSDVDRIKIAINRYCKEKDMDPRIILAIMARESGFNPNAVSPSGALGLGQILPLNYEELKIQDPHDIDQNTKGVVYYFKLKLDDWKGSQNQLQLALASYLKGTGDIKRAGGKIDGHTETYVNDILRIRTTI